MTLVSAFGVVLSRNVVHSALFMSGSFLGVAGFFVMLNAPALAAFQVLIYVGAVTGGILFGIMFTQRAQVRGYRSDRKSKRPNSSHRHNLYALFCLKKKKTAQPFHTLTPYTLNP